MDPPTAAVLALNEIRGMAAEMLECEKQWLPQFARKRIRSTPAIVTPKGIQHAHVPVDPALAIDARFGELAR